MPQMAPMNWLFLFMFFMMLYTTNMILNYFMIMYTMKMKFLHKTSNKNNWKW
uniref:ATP synthase F0 subunit 8 n=1 Tax=Hylesinus varius TaxID=141158 RepID=A0A343C4T4_9CUCU|nr:ATP synthase F0 subunit 8 [Hylesinus varius]